MNEFEESWFRQVFDITKEMIDKTISDCTEGTVVENEDLDIIENQFDTNLTCNEEERKYMCAIMEDFYVRAQEHFDCVYTSDVGYPLYSAFIAYFANLPTKIKRDDLDEVKYYFENNFKNEDLHKMLEEFSIPIIADIIALLNFMIRVNIEPEIKQIFHKVLLSINDYMHTTPLSDSDYEVMYLDPQGHTDRELLSLKDDDTLSD